MLAQCLDGVAHWSLEIYYREAVTSVTRIVNALISGALEELGQDGITILNACVSSMHTLAKHYMCVRYCKAICSTTMHILCFRLKNGPKSAWEDLDTSLLELLDCRGVQPVSIQMVSGILEILVKEDWGPEGEQLRVSLTSAISHAVVRD
jgi:glutamate/tyrosine decarboxylase-like PLP-dependent enzyme